MHMNIVDCGSFLVLEVSFLEYDDILKTGIN